MTQQVEQNQEIRLDEVKHVLSEMPKITREQYQDLLRQANQEYQEKVSTIEALWGASKHDQSKQSPHTYKGYYGGRESQASIIRRVISEDMPDTFTSTQLRDFLNQEYPGKRFANTYRVLTDLVENGGLTLIDSGSGRTPSEFQKNF